mmetsp:Transcript_37944/g.95290  ORF Transcript_37944/g.95290 Transcript_37944/m.95290 type:complete len:267 (-) Transcript_37944:489-1289(-)
MLQPVVSTLPSLSSKPMHSSLSAPLASARVLKVCPPPHVRSQSCQADQSPMTQVCGASEARRPQPAVCANSASQALPPLRGGVSITRRRIFCSPVMHGVHSSQDPITQSMASAFSQACSPQPRFSESGVVQGLPPFAARVMMVRSLVCWPPPHVSEQPLHSIHTDTAQSTGWLQPLPQTSVSASTPSQSWPPCSGGVSTVRERSRWQSTFSPHSLHPLHWARTQSCGTTSVALLLQVLTSHSLLSFRGPSHGFPPQRLGCAILRVL